ncbi:MAG TPA: cytochrome c biogenesis protein ResB [Mycobacteriales bacterium]|nr:cytochrome c biogenesis protein ResB [Mycobacteriales bacterium]
MTETLPETTSAAERLSTAPAYTPSGRNPLLRAWRQLTSMRTALLLLALLALAAVPGTLLPQRGLNPAKVAAYFSAHPHLAPWLDKLSLFDVFAAPWFAAIYLLLFVSLIGCLIPRLRLHVRAMRRQPPRAPRHLLRMTTSTDWQASDVPQDVVAHAAGVLRSRRWRTVVTEEADGAVSVAAEKGYLRETGNLVFHVALLLLLTGIALGGMFGYKGTVLVTVGDGFSNVQSSYDVFSPSRFFSNTHLPPFSFTLQRFTATYEPNGQPRSFDAVVGYQRTPNSAPKTFDIRPNDPLSVDGSDVYLVGHGYALQIQVRDPHGRVVYNNATPFLPDDAMFTSHGVVKVPNGLAHQLGLTGFFYPTYGSTALGAQSVYPAADDPTLDLAAWQGDLGLSSGQPQSVYDLPVASLKNVGTTQLTPGKTWRLADGTSVTFVGVRDWATFQVAHDPGTKLVLVAAVLIVLGLLASLRVRRRRFWLRAAPAAAGAGSRRTVVHAAGLARSDADGNASEFDRLVHQLKD